jgi:hypothetical protein
MPLLRTKSRANAAGLFRRWRETCGMQALGGLDNDAFDEEQA